MGKNTYKVSVRHRDVDTLVAQLPQKRKQKAAR